jgi:hypothetical protein
MLPDIDRSGLQEGPRLVFDFFGGTSDFLLKLNIFFPVNAKITPIAYVVRLILYLYSRQAFLTNAVSFMRNQSEAASILCKPIVAEL